MKRYDVGAVCFLAMALILTIGMSFVFADTAVGNAAEALGIKLPAWLQAVLGIGGTAATGAAAAWAFMSKKIRKAILLYDDSRLVIHEFVESATMIQNMALEPDKKKQWNEQIDSIVKLLNDTEQKAMMQIAQTLLKKKLPE